MGDANAGKEGKGDSGPQIEIAFPGNAPWPGVRDVTENECRIVIERYHLGDKDVAAMRWGKAMDRFALSACVEGRFIKVQVLCEDGRRYLVLGANEA